MAVVKYYTSDGKRIWYASEFNGLDKFFGLVVVDFVAEMGNFNLSELKQFRDSEGDSVLRDIDFRPTTLQKLMELMDFYRNEELPL